MVTITYDGKKSIQVPLGTTYEEAARLRDEIRMLSGELHG